MKEIAIAIIAGVFSGGIFSFVQFLIQRTDGRKEWRKGVDERLDKIEEQQKKDSKKTEKDNLRMQLLFLMYVIPENKEEILQLADYYFRVLKADFYLTPLFQKWLIEHNMEIPAWFSGD